MFLTNLIPPPYNVLVRVGVVVLILVGAFATGWIKRGAHDENKLQAQIIAQQATVIRIHSKQDQINGKLVGQLQIQLSSLRKRNDQLQKDILTLPDTCELSSDWVHIYNDSIKASDAGNTSGTDGKVGASDVH